MDNHAAGNGDSGSALRHRTPSRDITVELVNGADAAVRGDGPMGDAQVKFREPRAAADSGTTPQRMFNEFLQLLPFNGCVSPPQSAGAQSGKDPAWALAEGLLPCLSWLRIYDWANVHKDLVAGLTVGIMLVPQGMAYAMIAGLPPVYGLYSAIIPIYMYSILGTSRQLAVGPVALVSMMTEATLSGMAAAESPRYIELATRLGFYCGAVQFLMGVFRFGFVVNFLGHAVISGFTSGAAILIGLSQLKHLLGYSIKKSHLLHETVKYTLDGIGGFHTLTFCTGLVWIAMLIIMKRVGKTYPKLKFVRAIGPLSVVTVSILVTRLFDLKAHGVKIVGAIESGFPSPTNMFGTEDMSSLLPSAAVISLVGFLESIAIAKGIAARRGYRVEATQELVALGASNIFGSMFSSYPVTGSFSRSAVNDDIGGVSGLSGVATATLIVFTLLFLTPLFYFLPKNVLAAVVMSSVIGLVDVDEVKFLWKVNKKDLLLWSTSFLGTLFLGIELGIGIAVGISLMFVIYETARPHVAILGKLPGTRVYRSIHQYPEAETHEGIVIMRIDAPIYFANVDFIKDKLRECEALSTAAHQEGRLRGIVRFFVIEMTPVFSIDSSGIHSLLEIVKEFESRDIKLVVSNPNGGVMKSLETAGIADRIGRQWMFLRCVDAVNACLAEMQKLGTPLASPATNGASGGDGGASDEAEAKSPRDVEAPKHAM